MKLDMDESDSTKRKKWALQGVENCEVVGDVCRHTLEDDLALFVKQFRRILKNKGKEKHSAGVKHKGFARKGDKGLSKVLSPCFACKRSGTMLVNVLTPNFLDKSMKKPRRLLGVIY